MNTIQFQNGFHNSKTGARLTSTAVNAAYRLGLVDPDFRFATGSWADWQASGLLTQSQERRIRRALCGISSCCCGVLR